MKKSLYLQRYSYGPQIIEFPPDPGLEIVVVIPCYNEPDLLKPLNSLAACESTKGSVEVIVVVNQNGDESKGSLLDHNRATVVKRPKTGLTTQPSDITFHILNETLPERDAGVGLARKIGMDEAVRRFSTI